MRAENPTPPPIVREWETIDAAATAVGFQLGSDPASVAVRDYLWRAGDSRGRQLSPMPSCVGTGKTDSAEMESLLVGVANASRAWQEDQAAVVRMIRMAFEAARG